MSGKQVSSTRLCRSITYLISLLLSQIFEITHALADHTIDFLLKASKQILEHFYSKTHIAWFNVERGPKITILKRQMWHIRGTDMLHVQCVCQCTAHVPYLSHLCSRGFDLWPKSHPRNWSCFRYSPKFLKHFLIISSICHAQCTDHFCANHSLSVNSNRGGGESLF